MVREDIYSPLPQVERLPESLWTEPVPLIGLDLKVEAAIELLESTLQGYIREFSPRLDNTGAAGTFFVRNGTYESVDAEVLYAMLRHVKPSRVVELGSGASSHVIHAAQQVCVGEGHPFEHEIFDPYPFTASPMGSLAEPVVHPIGTESLDAQALTASLHDGDVLFVDTTHTVRTGGDVIRLFQDILPRLATGVWVHFHDIFLPYDYPRQWVVTERRAWSEQYLLQAFLTFNDRFQVIMPNHAAARAFPEIVSKVVPSFDSSVEPAGFWMRTEDGSWDKAWEDTAGAVLELPEPPAVDRY